MKITAIIVVYNKDVSLSSTCKKIKSYDYINLMVVDNSTTSTNNNEYCKKNEIEYVSMQGNKGLSKAYNTAIDSLRNTDVVVLLDDDTDVSEDYFVKLKKELLTNPDTDIFVPIIKGQDGLIYSPNNYNFFKNKLVKTPFKEINKNRFNAISSCMAIRMRVFDNYRYNEKLFVDEIDHCFCLEQRKLGHKFGIINTIVKQNFHQREDNISSVAAWNRIKIRVTDIFRYSRILGGGFFVPLAFLKCCGLGVQIGIKSKSPMVALKTGLLSFKLIFKR